MGLAIYLQCATSPGTFLLDFPQEEFRPQIRARHGHWGDVQVSGFHQMSKSDTQVHLMSFATFIQFLLSKLWSHWTFQNSRPFLQDSLKHGHLPRSVFQQGGSLKGLDSDSIGDPWWWSIVCSINSISVGKARIWMDWMDMDLRGLLCLWAKRYSQKANHLFESFFKVRSSCLSDEGSFLPWALVAFVALVALVGPWVSSPMFARCIWSLPEASSCGFRSACAAMYSPFPGVAPAARTKSIPHEENPCSLE